MALQPCWQYIVASLIRVARIFSASVDIDHNLLSEITEASENAGAAQRRNGTAQGRGR